MGYQLGIDLGTTFSAAAVHRDGTVEMAGLGSRGPAIPTVVFVPEDGNIVVGEAAARRVFTDPGRVGREFKRRVGDPTPLILGGVPHSPESLLARVLRWVLDTVSSQEGGSPDRVALTHPANWGPYKRELLQQVIDIAEVPVSTTLTEPEAAAIYYSSSERIDPGDTVAVYDLGGGTFDAAVLRKATMGFEILGEPEGIEHLGGLDFDEAIFWHVDEALGGIVRDLDGSDIAVAQAVARLREDSMLAKEALSTDTETSIPVFLPGARTEVRLTRAELEGMVRPPIGETVAALRRALRSARVEPEAVRSVLLVGGSSRIPLVGQVVTTELGRPIVVDAHPKHSIALGAAAAAASAEARRDVSRTLTVMAAAPPPPPRLAVRVVVGGEEPRTVQVDAPLEIGRVPGVDLILPDSEVSRRHALVAPVGSGLLVEDLGSTNGTFVDGTRISKPMVVSPGATLGVGGAIIQVVLEDSSPQPPG